MYDDTMKPFYWITKPFVWLLALAAAAITGADARYSKCTPKNDSVLQTVWSEQSHQSCLHDSVVMLPAMQELNFYKHKLLERSKCQNEVDCDIEKDYLCARCKPVGTFPNGCVDPRANSTMEVRSTCSYHYRNNTDDFRYPHSVLEAVCHKCNCGKAFTSEDSALYECYTVYNSVPVLYAKFREYDSNEECEYELKYQQLASGCTCARRLMGDDTTDMNKQHRGKQLHSREKCMTSKQIKKTCGKGYKKPFTKKQKANVRRCRKTMNKQRKNCVAERKKKVTCARWPKGDDATDMNKQLHCMTSKQIRKTCRKGCKKPFTKQQKADVRQCMKILNKQRKNCRPRKKKVTNSQKP